MLKSQIITPGKGIGNLTFGITQNEVKEILGNPDKIEYHNNIKDKKTIKWLYFKKKIELSFDPESDYKLSLMSTSSSTIKINGKEIIGKDRDDIIKDFAHNQFGFFNVSNHPYCKDSLQQVSFKDKNLNLWFTNNKLREIQISPIRNSFFITNNN